MKRKISEHWTFLREFRRTFYTTGAVAPSGRQVGMAFTKPLELRDAPFRILEVGPGTGAITAKIVKQLRPGDRFDAVELNERFVEALRKRFQNEPDFQRVTDQCQVLHQSIEDLPTTEGYDFIACGLPFNNFEVDSVRRIFRHLAALLRPGGTLGFFEYVWIRQLKSIVTSKAERRRTAQVARVLQRYIDRYEFQRKTILVNFPPAYIHFLQLEKQKA